MMDASVVSQVQRKIELQSVQDLAYLIANVRNGATARINEAFPQQGEDELRNQIESLVNKFIDETFALAAPNLSINGLPITPESLSSQSSLVPEAYEPFDGRKRQRVAELISQEERLLEEVAALKRSVPAEAAAEQARVLEAAIKEDDDFLERNRERATRNAGASVSLAVGNLERQDGIENAFNSAVSALGRLKRDMPAVVAKMERARVAGEYVKDSK